MVSIQGLSVAAVLAALYNASKPQGMGMLHYDPKPMTEEEAAGLLATGNSYFDYLKGRVMKVQLNNPEGFEERLYDRDNGPGAAQRVVDALRASGTPNNKTSAVVHEQATLAEANRIKGRLREKTQKTSNGIRLGLDDVKDVLGPAVDRAVQHQPTKQN